MMKLSTRSSYGLRACLALSRAEGKLSSSEIAEREGIPQRYLEQILASLRQGGFVESTRGARGGYSLARPPAGITVADLVSCLEGALPPILCSAPEHRSDTCRSESSGCSSSKLCCELETSLMNVLSSTTLAALAAGKTNLSSPCGEHPGGTELTKCSDNRQALPTFRPA
jgi:Rrf2 family protein